MRRRRRRRRAAKCLRAGISTDDPRQDPQDDRRTPYDAAYRKAYSHRRVIADLIRLLLSTFARRYDLSTLRQMPADFVTKALGQRHVDMLWRIDVGGGRWPHLYLHLEFQSSVERDMSMRTLEYSVCIWRALDRKDRGPKAEYPRVVAAVLNASERRWSAATNVRELFGADVPGDELPHVPVHEFRVFDLRWLDLGDPPPDNVAARLVRLEQAKSGGELVELTGRLWDLLEEEGAEQVIECVEPLVTEVLAARFVGEDGRPLDFTIPRKGENGMNLLERARKWGAERDQEWLEKGIQQGVEQGRREAACSMAARRFGAEAADRLGRALGGVSDPDRIDAAIALVFQCESVDELLAELAKRGH